MVQVMGSLDRVREQAASWLIELESADGKAAEQCQRDFECWLAEDKRHQQVYTQMQRMWMSVNPQHKQKRLRRFAAATCLGIFALAIGLQLPWGYWGADYRTAVGSIREISLPDGSTAILNTNSAVNVYYGEGLRSLELVRGEVLVDVRKDPQGRRFIVEAGKIEAEALGTRYSVDMQSQETRVRVYESRVLVNMQSHDQQQFVTQGQQVKVTDGRIFQPSGLTGLSPDWSRQQLVFNDVPLAEVVERLQQYHTGVLLLTSDLEGGLRRFTGLLPADNSAAAISLLADSMGLKVQRFSPYFVWIK